MIDINDPDSNGDGIIDCRPRDSDGDGIPDHLDPDDDNDGIPDYLDPDSMAFLLYKKTQQMDALPGKANYCLISIIIVIKYNIFLIFLTMNICLLNS